MKYLLSSVMIGAILLFVCMGGAFPASAGSVVYFYNWYGVDQQEQLFLDLVREFQATHPQIEVELVRGGGVDGRTQTDRLLALIAAGTPPDVVHFERSQVFEFAARGLLEPLDRYVGAIGEEFVPGALAEVTFQGAVYALPWGTDIRGLFWNKGDLEEAGFDAERGPASLEELDAMAARLTRMEGDGSFSKLGFIPWLGNWYSVGWLYTFGGDIYDAESARPRVNTPNHVRGFEWISEYGQRYPYPQVSAAISGKNVYTFYDRTVSMMAQWNGFTNFVGTADPSLDVAAGFVPHPPYGSNGTWMGGYAHVMLSAARNKDAAVALLTWMGSKESEVRLYRAYNSLPTRWSALQEIRDELTPTDALLVQQVDEAWGRPPLWFPQFYQRTTDAMLKVARLEVSAQAALDEAQRLLEVDFAEILEK